MQQYKKLRKLIKNQFGTYTKFAEYLGIHRVSLEYKLMGKNPFNSNEIKIVKDTFNLSSEETYNIFFE